MTSDDSGGYYAVHANYKLSNGLVAELQVITIRCMVYKSLIGHIFYEVRRELYPKKDTKKYKDIFKKLSFAMENGYNECRKADEKQEKIPYPKFDFTDEELDLIKDAVSGNTWIRFECLLNKRVKEINTHISDKEKKLVEGKYIDPYKFI